MKKYYVQKILRTVGTFVQKSLWTFRYVRNIFGPMFVFRNTNVSVPTLKNRCVQVRMIINRYEPICTVRARNG